MRKIFKLGDAPFMHNPKGWFFGARWRVRSFHQLRDAHQDHQRRRPVALDQTRCCNAHLFRHLRFATSPSLQFGDGHVSTKTAAFCHCDDWCCWLVPEIGSMISYDFLINCWLMELLMLAAPPCFQGAAAHVSPFGFHISRTIPLGQLFPADFRWADAISWHAVVWHVDVPWICNYTRIQWWFPARTEDSLVVNGARNWIKDTTHGGGVPGNIVVPRLVTHQPISNSWCLYSTWTQSRLPININQYNNWTNQPQH